MGTWLTSQPSQHGSGGQHKLLTKSSRPRSFKDSCASKSTSQKRDDFPTGGRKVRAPSRLSWLWHPHPPNAETTLMPRTSAKPTSHCTSISSENFRLVVGSHLSSRQLLWANTVVTHTHTQFSSTIICPIFLAFSCASKLKSEAKTGLQVSCSSPRSATCGRACAASGLPPYGTINWTWHIRVHTWFTKGTIYWTCCFFVQSSWHFSHFPN